jgi:hypothetical protein
MLRATTALITILISICLLATTPGRPLAKPAPAPGTTVVYITASGTRYHRENCTYLKQSKIKTTLAEAQRKHLKPCRKCKPPQ